MLTNRYFEKEYDVIIVGGGLAGVCAAIAAARNGANTAIIQARPVFGGNSSSEVRMHIVGAGCHNNKKNLIESGIIMELLLENKKRNPYQEFIIWDVILWEKIRFQKGLDSYLNTSMIDLTVENDAIQSITCYQSSTETSYRFTAPIFVDATGHGTLGARAGAEYRQGTESSDEFGEPGAPLQANDHTNGNTMMFVSTDRGEKVNFERPFWAYELSEEDLRYREHVDLVSAHAEGGVPTDFRDGDPAYLPQFTSFDSGYWWIELGGDYKDIIAHDEEIRDELLKYIFGVWDHIKNKGDHGADNYDLSWVGMVPGYRESRRLMGDYILTENDVRGNRLFRDAVAYGGWPMDQHIAGGIKDTEKLPSRLFHFEGAYSIPYRCYYSKNIKNLFMAGRDISVSKMAFGSTRVMGTCAVGGQAVGVAAALAIKHGSTPREIGRDHIEELQQLLLKEDCYLPGIFNQDKSDFARLGTVSAGSSKTGHEASNVINGVARAENKDANCWESETLNGADASITIQLPSTEIIHEVRLTFDPNLTREIMPSITRQVRERQVKGLPDELVKDYSITLYHHEKEVCKTTVFDNVQRLTVFEIEHAVKADRITVEVLATHGYPAARIFEIRIY